MSGLPTQIPQQSVPLIQGDGRTAPQLMDVNWYLWAYNISKAVLGLGQGGGTTPSSPYDALDAANLFAQSGDVSQSFRQISNLSVLRAVGDLPVSAPAAQPVQSVSPGASPFIYTALQNGVLSITGGAVSAVSILRQGVAVATGITSSSSSAVATLTDEKGSGGQPGFVAGVDFTNGVTTTLTLSKSYGSASNLWVAFDASEQGANSFTLSGSTLTFNAPIIASVVFVKGASPATVSSSGGGLVPLQRLDKVQITYTSAPAVAFLPS